MNKVLVLFLGIIALVFVAYMPMPTQSKPAYTIHFDKDMNIHITGRDGKTAELKDLEDIGEYIELDNL